MNWDDIRYFLSVAETGTLSTAAARLQVSPSTVSRRIEALEAALNVRLFRPHRDGYDLTPAGRALIPAAERAGAQMHVFERSARGGDSVTSGPVRIEAPELLAQDVLLPALASLLQQHPNLRVELRASVRSVRLAGEDADIILRLSRPDQGNYRQRKVGQVAFGLYASPDHATGGMPSSADDLLRHRIIGWSEDLRHLTMARWLEDLQPHLEPALRLTSLAAQLAAVRMGLGWAVLPVFAAEPAGLVPGLTDVPRHTADLWMLVHQQTGHLPRVEAVKAVLRHAVDGLAHVPAYSETDADP
ncbi:LysR family transcriptional regulator [Falsirhodobacter sp. 20TX0035]|uniref:LysR family transcriptional regulator n=1 Tax=Falsirhodobacter sp. 20TX0035 TaxID=3022019 RepID=UPI00232CEB99|nr:LysR family transcriptional regulator [Falsirhodobacter sp. 20TX0035]MDB6454923.1 LysR family transcriptional regulator [Falsirhodobacter sp. 20TX0035]